VAAGTEGLVEEIDPDTDAVKSLPETDVEAEVHTRLLLMARLSSTPCATTDKCPGEPCLPGSGPGGRRPSSPLTVVAGPNHPFALSHYRRRARLVDSAGLDPTPRSVDQQGFRSASSPAIAYSRAARTPAKRRVAFVFA
jgi:hypothetical protein